MRLVLLSSWTWFRTHHGPNEDRTGREDRRHQFYELRDNLRAKAKELLRGQRKAGGQPGHQGSGRELRPEDQLDEIVDHYPDACRGCGREFSADERRPSGRFGRHQLAELPPITVVWVEHRTHRLRCPACREKTPPGCPR